MEEILEKAKECLNCKNPMCKKNGCPVSTNIPAFINEIKNNNLKKAYCILQENNILSSICARICPVEEQCMRFLHKRNKGTSSRNRYFRTICK